MSCTKCIALNKKKIKKLKMYQSIKKCTYCTLLHSCQKNNWNQFGSWLTDHQTFGEVWSLHKLICLANIVSGSQFF